MVQVNGTEKAGKGLAVCPLDADRALNIYCYNGACTASVVTFSNEWTEGNFGLGTVLGAGYDTESASALKVDNDHVIVSFHQRPSSGSYEAKCQAALLRIEGDSISIKDTVTVNSAYYAGGQNSMCYIRGRILNTFISGLSPTIFMYAILGMTADEKIEIIVSGSLSRTRATSTGSYHTGAGLTAISVSKAVLVGAEQAVNAYALEFDANFRITEGDAFLISNGSHGYVDIAKASDTTAAVVYASSGNSMLYLTMLKVDGVITSLQRETQTLLQGSYVGYDVAIVPDGGMFLVEHSGDDVMNIRIDKSGKFELVKAVSAVFFNSFGNVSKPAIIPGTHVAVQAGGSYTAVCVAAVSIDCVKKAHDVISGVTNESADINKLGNISILDTTDTYSKYAITDNLTDIIKNDAIDEIQQEVNKDGKM